MKPANMACAVPLNEPLPGQQPLGDIKYDPMLPEIPAAAARVLQRVERDRAYAEFRLAMLEREERTG